MQALDSHWHNPSSLYPTAGEVKHLLEESRETLAQHLGIDDAQRIIFTSGATESNNLVVRHVAATSSSSRILVSEIEHPSVLQPSALAFGERFEKVLANETGVIDLNALADQLRGQSVSLLSIMAANNETGVLQPWSEANELCRKYHVPFHCDAVQWLGKRPATQLGECDWLSGSAHKFGGPKGVGFLVTPPEIDRLHNAQSGGPQERGLRAGTENYPAIAAMLAALGHAERLSENSDSIGRERDDFESRILELIPGTQLCGANAPRLWNTSMLVLPEHRNLKWLTRMGDLGFALSTGSACSSGRGNPSHVMQAMGLDFDEMGRVLRISAGWETTPSDWNALSEALAEVYQSLNSNAKRATRSNTISLTDINSYPDSRLQSFLQTQRSASK